MKNLAPTKPLVKETAGYFRTAQGKRQFLETLEKVSGKVEITPPITLDKLMSVFGTTALMFPPNFANDKSLEAGRITTAEEREMWVAALSSLERLLNNSALEKEVFSQANSINLKEINSLEGFAEELAIRTKVLLMEIENANPGYKDSKPLPNQLKIGEMLCEQLDNLVLILEIDENLQANSKHKEPDAGEENQRASGIATEALLKKNFLPVSSSASYQAMREVVALKKFIKDVESPFPTAYVEKSSIRGKIQLTPLQSETVYGEKLKELEMSMWQKREQLSDLHVDVIDAMCATWIIQASSEESRAVITADDILKLRGLKAHLSGTGRRGGYTPEQRTEVISAIQDLENIWFEITEKVKRGKKVKSDFIQSRAVVVTDRGGQIRIDGSLDVMWFVFRPGSIFARYLLTEGRQSALLAAQALRYNVRTQAVEKRLVRYLSWQWRIRSKSATYMQPYEAQTLIKESGIKVPERNANRACERLEKALDKLQSDGLIQGWQYADWNWDNAKKHGWINAWLATKIVVEPPDLIRDSYQSIGQIIDTQLLAISERTPAPRDEKEIAQQAKIKRKSLKLSQMQLAEMLALSQPTLSRIESGRKVSSEETKKILDWLASNENPADKE